METDASSQILEYGRPRVATKYSKTKQDGNMYTATQVDAKVLIVVQMTGNHNTTHVVKKKELPWFGFEWLLDK